MKRVENRKRKKNIVEKSNSEDRVKVEGRRKRNHYRGIIGQ